jgi:N-acetylmuramoyl-L-alanine amidase
VSRRYAVLSAVAGIVAAVLLVGALAEAAGPLTGRHEVGASRDGEHGTPGLDRLDQRGAAKPLKGRTIVLDPGHQLGNHNFPAQINRPVPAGGFDKPCNTTGTATNGGYDEATFTWKVAKRLQAKLVKAGATVVMTRHSNSESKWGPCVDVRGRAGNTLPGGGSADLKISIHGDGSYAAGAHGFHVIYAPDRAPWTDDTYAPSMRAAGVLKQAMLDKGFSVANYIAGGDGIDVRSDLGTLNLSDVPTVMVECGNMRDAGEAKVMTSPKGQARYAAAMAAAVRRYLR